MARDQNLSHAIYASDLLGHTNALNAITLNGLDSSAFFRTDVSSAPHKDMEIDLGSETSRIRKIFTDQIWGVTYINGIDLSNFMRLDKTNLPTISASSENDPEGLDLGGPNAFWRKVYARTGVFTTLAVDNITTSNGSKFSHNDFADNGGTDSHATIAAHMATRAVTSISGTNNVHGGTWENTPYTIVVRNGSRGTELGSIIPVATNNLADLGNTTNIWNRLYVKDIFSTNITNTGNIKNTNSSGSATITTDNLVVTNGITFSDSAQANINHLKIANRGTYTHAQLDAHYIAGASNNTLVHGATASSVANKIMARDASQNVYANIYYGTAQKANYADLAEKYTSKEKARVGTLYCVSSKDEYDVEICMLEACSNVVGVVSDMPGFVMNESIDGVQLGLKGKVKIRVIGPVKKGELLISAGDGCAKAANNSWLSFKIGIANETNLSCDEKLIEGIL